MNIKIGADPEVFVRDKSNGIIINADGMVNGTKENPEPVDRCGQVGRRGPGNLDANEGCTAYAYIS